MSPYIYAGNVPTRFIDFDGNDFGIRIDFKNGIITISQTFYTDGNEKTNRLAKETSDYLNSLSGVFGYKTKKNGTFTINFQTNVIEGKNEEDGKQKADDDDTGNFFNIEESSLAPALRINPLTGRGIVAVTEEGGDWTIFTNNESVTVKTFKHEDLHGFGASHQAIGGDSDDYSSMNERVIGAMFTIASANINNLSIKSTNYKKRDALTDRKGFPESEIPKVKAAANGGNTVKLNGTIIRLIQ